MTGLLWVTQGLLALVFLLAGGFKLLTPSAQLVKRQPWTANSSQRMVRGIGVAEALGALGLILPGVTHIAPALTGIAALGLALVMASALGFHLARHEAPHAVVPVVLGLLAVFVLYGRFALAPLS
ncbi:MAG TPA: DoxX family protein [Ktedonobacterales bacterium]|nr:DoxX family protein [Ktedonobacterales bacterium]HEX5570062.1 DoxX family protein [Ktedonobacterales bacterium]